MDEEMKSKVVDVVRKNHRVRVVKLIIEEKVLNIVNVYVLQVGCEEKDKDVFWRVMNKVLQGIQVNEDTVIGGDINEHVGSERRGYERIHGVWF